MMAMVAAAALASATATAQTTTLLEREQGIADVCFVDANTGWLASGDTLLRTTDGGATWTALSSRPLPAADLLAIDFVDASHGCATGSGGAYATTTDGGLTWRPGPQVSPFEAVVDVDFVTADVGVAVGSDFSVYRTTDGGGSWLYDTLPMPTVRPHPVAVSFSTPNDGWIVSNSNYAWKTTDGGRHWELVGDDAGPGGGWPGGEPRDIRFTTPTMGFLCNWYPWGLFRTSDAGASWEWLGFDYPVSIDFLNDGLYGVFATTDDVVRTSDGGITWADTIALGLEEPLMVEPQRVAMLDASSAVVVISGGGATPGRLVRLNFATSGVARASQSPGLRVWARDGAVGFAMDPIDGGSTLRLIDMAGRVVGIRRFDGVVRAARGTLPAPASGVYLVELVTADGRTVRRISVP